MRRHRDDSQPSAMVVNRVQVGEVVESPLVYWTLLLMWPAASRRERLYRIALGVPVFAALEVITTVYQLTYSLADASGQLAGDRSAVTLWDRWSRILEAGGRFALESGLALSCVSAGRLLRHPRV